MKALTLKQLETLGACDAGKEWFKNQTKKSVPKIVEALLKTKDFTKIGWANWLLPRLLDKRNKVFYAAFAAEQVLHLYEEKYPDDNRPRKAIEAAMAWAGHPTDALAYAAYAAAYAADAAAYAAYAAAYAAYAAAYAADAAAYAAYAAAYADAAAAYAAYAADAGAYAARLQVWRSILSYGLLLLESQKED